MNVCEAQRNGWEARLRWKRLILALLPAVVLGGCNAAWRGYGRITLGDPLPEGHILRRRGKFKQPTWQWVNTESTYIPLAYNTAVLSAAVDNDGLAVGKRYMAGGYAHWLACQSVTWHEVMEVRVPQEAFHDPPPDWVRPKPPDGDRLAAIAEALAPLIEEISELDNRHKDQQGLQRSLSGREVVGSVAVSIHPRRLAKPVRDAIQTGRTDIPVEPGKDVDVSGLWGADLLAAPDVETRIVADEDKRPSLKAILRIPSPPCGNVLEYLLLVQSQPSPDAGGSAMDIPMLHALLSVPRILFSGVLGSKTIDLRDAAAYPACLLGVTREGFDWRYTGPVGGSLRIQNLGNRRIRVESRSFAVYDALWLVGWVEVLAARMVPEGHLYHKVIRDLTRALRRDPENVDLLVARAMTYELGKNDEKAVADYNRALELDPKHTLARTKRDAIQHKWREYYALIVGFSRSLTVDPDHRFTISYRGRTFHWEDADKAIAVFTAAIERHPNSAAAYNNRAVSYYHKRQWDRALADFTRAVELDPQHAKAYRNRAYVHYRRRRYGEAWADVQKCRALGATVDAKLLDALRKASPEPLKKSDRNTSTKPAPER